MKLIHTTLTSSILLLIGMPASSAQDIPRLGESTVREVIGAMTTDEKARLLVGMGMNIDIPGGRPRWPATPEKVPGAAGRTHPVERLGIPSLTLSDGPAGVRIDPIREGDSVRTYHATAFPVATLLASSWDTSVVRTVGKSFGHEAREYGIDILLAPGLNIHRNPLGGRNFEYYSEDPLLSGYMAAAFVEGVQSKGVGTSIKHFAANNQEFNRMMMNTVVSQRALREIYLKGFKLAVERARPWTVMSAYNLINGTYASESQDLLTTVLRDEWGFEGFVMTDWFGGRNAVAQVAAGNDALMPGNPDQAAALVAAVESGALQENALDASVERVLQIVLQSPTYRGLDYSDSPDLASSAEVARRVATEGMVLLKNEDRTLPLPPAIPVALFGNASYDLIVGGTGSGDVNEAYSVPLSEGLKDTGYTILQSLEGRYQKHITDEKAKRPPPPMPFMLPPPIPELPADHQALHRALDEAAIAVLTIGRNSGEFEDRRVEGDFELTETEHALIRDVSEAFHAAGKKVVVVMNVGGVIEVSSWRNSVDAILLAWQPGQEGGRAIADILSGAVNPSGKLPMTFPVAYEDVPSAKNFPGKELETGDQAGRRSIFGRPSEVTYDEGIYVGYRYYDTFGVKPAFSFGHGLSYTEFEYGDLALTRSAANGTVTMTATVKNAGDIAGREIVQLYVRAPQDHLDKPKRELRAFAKTGLLKPGESEQLIFTLSPGDFASFDASRSAWVAERGTYVAEMGASIADIRGKVSFTLDREWTHETHNVLAPIVDLRERRPPPK